MNNSRILTIDDLPAMMRIYDSQDNLLKVKKTVHIDEHYRKILPLYLNDNPSMIAFGAFDGDQMIAFSTLNVWDLLPHWTMGLFHTDAASINLMHDIESISMLKDYMSVYAESRSLYTGYSISTMSALSTRAWQQLQLEGTNNNLWDNDCLRYDITIEEIVAPYTGSRSYTFSSTLGILEGLNDIPLVITRWSVKNKYRLTDISKSCIKRFNKLAEHK